MNIPQHPKKEGLFGLVSIQDLREAIASILQLRATHVSLITGGKRLWDSNPFDLCDLQEETITVCVRDPQLCQQDQHEIPGFNFHGLVGFLLRMEDRGLKFRICVFSVTCPAVQEPCVFPDGFFLAPRILTFCNNGYNDKVCIHCGGESWMENRTREPKR